MIPKLTRQNLNGVWVALLTPWTDDDQLDEKKFREEIRSYAGTGVDGVYTGGTTGEFYAQDDATYDRITKIACEEAHAAKLPVQIGCTTLATRTARQRIATAIKAGANGIQIAHPFWLELRDDEAEGFVGDICKASGDVGVILYATGRAKRKLPPAMLAKLAHEHLNFVGMKDTGSDIPTVKALLAEAPDLSIFGGEDTLIARMQAGGRGAYSSVVGFSPRLVVELYQHCQAGRWTQAQPLNDLINRMMNEVFIPWVKEGLYDSAIDRCMRLAGGFPIGIRCQGPHRSATPAHLKQLEDWCQVNAAQWVPQAARR